MIKHKQKLFNKNKEGQLELNKDWKKILFNFDSKDISIILLVFVIILMHFAIQDIKNIYELRLATECLTLNFLN